MTLPRTVSDVVVEHVTFEVECIDRMYLNVYVPQLQYEAGLVGYVHQQLGLPIASTAPLGKITDRFRDAVRDFARQQRVPWVDFVKANAKMTSTRRIWRRLPAPRGCCSSAGHRRRRTLHPRSGASWQWLLGLLVEAMVPP